VKIECFDRWVEEEHVASFAAVITGGRRLRAVAS
jgi:hypothetical protein